jgi:hypothetical protein
MWEPQPLTTLRASKACRGENFTFYLYLVNVNILAPNTESPKTKCRIFSETEQACYLLHTIFLVGLFFDPEDGGDMFIRLSINYTVLYPRRQNSS